MLSKIEASISKEVDSYRVYFLYNWWAIYSDTWGYCLFDHKGDCFPVSMEWSQA